MIYHARVPLRVSILGGGSDLPEFIQMGGAGACLSVSIPYYVHCYAAKTEFTEGLTLDPTIQTPLTMALLEKFFYEKDGMPRALQDTEGFNKITFFEDVPTMGTGLGSSAAWLRAMCTALKKHATVTDLFDVERSTGSSCGYQDHAAAANPGFALHEFRIKDEEKSPRHNRQSVPGDLDNHWILKNLNVFYLGGKRDSNNILSEQAKNISSQFNAIKRMSLLAYMGYTAACSSESNGMIILKAAMTEAWEIKREFATGVTNDEIDTVYKAGIAAGGVIGGKILGAGGSGYMMFITEPGYSPRLRSEMEKLGLRELIAGMERPAKADEWISGVGS